MIANGIQAAKNLHVIINPLEPLLLENYSTQRQ